MIRINLLGEKVDKSGVYLLESLILGSALFVTVVACVFVHSSVSSDLSLAQEEQTLLENQLLRLKRKTKKVRELEKNKDLLKEKLTTIATLKAKKHGPVRMLDDLNSSLPEQAWLDRIEEKGDILELGGVALDNQTIAKLMQALEASEYFGNIDLIHSTLQIVDDVKLKRFSVSAKLKDPLEVRKAREAKLKKELEAKTAGAKKVKAEQI